MTYHGEVVVGPFWFGRAFDLPPRFEVSAVIDTDLDVGEAPFPQQITVGVFEWLQDEQEMYVGAMLWVVQRPATQGGWTFVEYDQGTPAPYLQQLPVGADQPQQFRFEINFEGNALKGYSNVHPLRSYAAPREAMLE